MSPANVEIVRAANALANAGSWDALSIDVRGADAYEIKDDRIARAIIGYPDVAGALAAVGPAKLRG